ncbi:CD180 antigen-like isoform X1 [Diabrotica undecimpunctata]|uniref:CD180 antigen-like isoform X1 n=1 Tax=Diabrotica undecimpunctata TaxID=50387 RepID=UPI003B6426CC
MKNLGIFAVFTILLIYTQADSDDFPLCKACGCSFNSNNTEANVTCTKPNTNQILQHYFWIKNGTNDSIPYNRVVINNEKFINFTYVFPSSQLVYLNLAYNSIFNISDSIFKNLQNMQVLILSYNDLEIIHPDTFKGLYLPERLMPLKSLKELRLDHNKIHTLNQDTFEHTTDIQILDLSYNPFEVIDHHTLLAINNLLYLKELYLQNTEITTLPDNMLHTPKYLRILDLSGNHGIEKIPETLYQARSLENLYLNNTGFVNLTEKNGFPDLPSLQVLHLCRNEHLHRLARFALAGLTNLTDLRLCDNIDLTTIDDFAFAKPTNVSGGVIWPPLKKLHIGNNKLSYIDSDIVARWDSLTELDIRDNPWTCDCENQWLIDDLMPIYIKLDENAAKQVMCAAPIEMEKTSFHHLLVRQSQMRCLDTYGHRPEKDGLLLVGVLTDNGMEVTKKAPDALPESDEPLKLILYHEQASDDDYVEMNDIYVERTNAYFNLLCGFTVGILVAIPAVLLMILAYQKKWFSIQGMFDKSPASYSRRFYADTAADDF